MTSITRRSLMAGMILTAASGAACTRPVEGRHTTDQGGSMGFTNPVVDSDVPDPMIMVDDEGGWWAFATNGNGANVQTLRSTDLVSWEQAADALPQLPSWTATGSTWAPEVSRGDDGRWLLYYTTPAPSDRGDIHSIGVAVADSPGGPYLDSSPEPLVCETDDGGSIDAHPFTSSDGQRYLYWKNDGNRIGIDTWISVQRLDSSGTRLIGKPQRLIKQDQPWEGSLVEAPFVVEVDGTFWLFYSGNAFDSAAYAVGVAQATSPAGPFTKVPDPVLVSNDIAAGPGHCAVVTVAGRRWMVYHAWAPDAIGASIPGRTMWLSEVEITADAVRVTPPTVDCPDLPIT